MRSYIGFSNGYIQWGASKNLRYCLSEKYSRAIIFPRGSIDRNRIVTPKISRWSESYRLKTLIVNTCMGITFDNILDVWSGMSRDKILRWCRTSIAVKQRVTETRETGADTSNSLKNQQSRSNMNILINFRTLVIFKDAENALEFLRVSQLSHGRHFIILITSQNIRKNWGDPSQGYYPRVRKVIPYHHALSSTIY